jgi:hypothetical protein
MATIDPNAVTVAPAQQHRHRDRLLINLQINEQNPSSSSICLGLTGACA